MPVTYQRNLLSTEYNGWENYETWNVALWINNDEGLYHLAMEVGNYVDFIDLLNDQGIVSTPDGVKFNDPKVNVVQLNSDVFDLWLTHKTHTVINTLMRYIPQSKYSFDEICKQCSDAINRPSSVNIKPITVSYDEVRKFYHYSNSLLVAR